MRSFTRVVHQLKLLCFLQNDTTDPKPVPTPATTSQLFNTVVNQIVSMSTNPIFLNSTCAACQAALDLAKIFVMIAPDQGPSLLVAVCERFNFTGFGNCETALGPLSGQGEDITQVLTFADVGGLDGQMLCENFLGMCPRAPTTPLDLTALNWFAKPKPNPLPPPKPASGKRLKVLHLSDAHIDPREYRIEILCCCID